jgi:hypothetical protein
MEAIKHRNNKLSNVWIFDSPKNDRRLIIEGDLVFMNCVCMEGDPAVVAYDLDPAPIYVVAQGKTSREFRAHVLVHLTGGRKEWCRYEYERSHRGKNIRNERDPMGTANTNDTVTCRVFTDQDLYGKLAFFDNWCVLCAAITRARGISTYLETKRLQERLQIEGEVILGSLLEEEGCDPAITIAVIARCLQGQVIETDLVGRLIGVDSLLRRRAS